MTSLLAAVGYLSVGINVFGLTLDMQKPKKVALTPVQNDILARKEGNWSNENASNWMGRPSTHSRYHAMPV